MNVLVISDNSYMYRGIKMLFEERNDNGIQVEYFRSPSKKKPLETDPLSELQILDIKVQTDLVIKEFELVISAHSKQIFPAELVQRVKCINIHPGYNPYNRGWYPQVFSIINDTVIGATIHLMDSELDHGEIIARRQVEKFDYDTSLSLYNRVQNAELELLKQNLDSILLGDYKTVKPEIEGDLYMRTDFEKLCELDLSENLTMGQAIDRLRALTHGNYKNAFFYSDGGKRIFVSLKLENEV